MVDIMPIAKRPAQKITAMNIIDDPAAECANNKPKRDHCKADKWLLCNQKKCSVAHCCSQYRNNTAKTEPARYILRHHNNGPATTGKRAKRGGNRHLPDRRLAQRRSGINIQNPFNAIENEECTSNKGADLDIGIGNRLEQNVIKLRFDMPHHIASQ